MRLLYLCLLSLSLRATVDAQVREPHVGQKRAATLDSIRNHGATATQLGPDTLTGMTFDNYREGAYVGTLAVSFAFPSETTNRIIIHYFFSDYKEAAKAFGAIGSQLLGKGAITIPLGNDSVSNDTLKTAVFLTGDEVVEIEQVNGGIHKIISTIRDWKRNGFGLTIKGPTVDPLPIGW